MYIGTDVYGRAMYLENVGNHVRCTHIKEQRAVSINDIEVSSDIIRMFRNPQISGAYIYEEIRRRYGKRL